MTHFVNFPLVCEQVVRNEVPSYSADVWSVMCVFVELLTAKQPWCYHYEFTPQQLIFKVSEQSSPSILDHLLAWMEQSCSFQVLTMSLYECMLLCYVVHLIILVLCL